MPGLGEGDRRLPARGPVHAWCTDSSSPTPPTTPTSCCRRPRSSSTTTCTSPTAICTCSRTIRRSRRWARRSPTPRCSGCSRRAWASPRPASATRDEDICRQALALGESAHGGHRAGSALKERGLAAARTCRALRAVRRGRLSHAFGQVRVLERGAGEAGHRPAAVLQSRRASRRAATRQLAAQVSARLHLAAGAQLPQLDLRQPAALPRRWKASRASTSIPPTPRRAASRDGDRVRVFNDRGSFAAAARVSTASRAAGVVVAPSVWWKKLSPDGRNANDVTSQRIADLGGAATFYDCLVEVERADASGSLATTGEERLQAARVAALYGVGRSVYLTSPLVAALVLVLLWELPGRGVLLAWFAAVRGRHADARGAAPRLPARRQRAPAQALAWERRFALGALAAGAAWSLSAGGVVSRERPAAAVRAAVRRHRQPDRRRRRLRLQRADLLRVLRCCRSRRWPRSCWRRPDRTYQLMGGVVLVFARGDGARLRRHPAQRRRRAARARREGSAARARGAQRGAAARRDRGLSGGHRGVRRARPPGGVQRRVRARLRGGPVAARQLVGAPYRAIARGRLRGRDRRRRRPPAGARRGSRSASTRRTARGPPCASTRRATAAGSRAISSARGAAAPSACSSTSRKPGRRRPPTRRCSTRSTWCSRCCRSASRSSRTG